MRQSRDRVCECLRWSIDRRAPATPSRISTPVAEIVRGTDVKAFHPSAVERESGTGHYVLVAAVLLSGCARMR